MVAEAGARPVAVVVGTMPDPVSAIFTGLDVASEPVLQGKEAVESSDRSRRAVGLGLHLLLNFPEVWPIFAISDKDDRDSFFFWLFKLASEGMIPDDQMKTEGQALNDLLSGETEAIIRRCHILNARRPGTSPIHHFLNHRSFLFDPTGSFYG